MSDKFKSHIKKSYKKDSVWQSILKALLKNSTINKMKFILKNDFIYHKQRHKSLHLIIFSFFKKKIFEIIYNHNNYKDINHC